MYENLSDVIRPRRTVLVPFAFIWTVIAAYFAFLLVDAGEASLPFQILELILGILMAPINVLVHRVGDFFRGSVFGTAIGYLLLLAYFYAVSVAFGVVIELVSQ
ncbi:hypothetical protein CHINAEXTREME_06495 [Halobiforma lacisalsi AJ5]|uniref:Uncharacterized protein n=1 Tax=Natronobacterium lacisalsi AJ5 TaxID=358396 RepID=M0LXT4_NATLA|nr:hypothetical protein [Halobiforma lacisalsi]APW97439.1 hypothetical protein CHINAEXTREME_06495 [Halobiforma lacisalsi AJ5]EMA38261.1 hypothetical protein C445_00130 [Halobiforma lacisalsi AJ5]